MKKKYEIFTSENGFSVRDKQKDEIVYKYDKVEVFDTLADIKAKLKNER